MNIRTIPNFNNYEISDCGKIFAKARYVLNHGTPVFKPRKQLKPACNGIGYLQIGLRVGKKVHRKYIHVLVALTFLGRPKKHNLEVNHKDRNKKNNHVDNLEYITHKANMRHWRVHKATLSQTQDTSCEGAETTGEVQSS